MARKTTRTARPDAAPSAPHPAPDTTPAPDAIPVPGSPAAAVCAALAASPGATVADIAGAAGTSRPATRDALAALEAAGAATRVKGGRPGIPDTWTLASPPAAEPAQPGDGPAAGEPAHSAPEEAAEGSAPDGDAPAPASPGPEADRDDEASDAPAPAEASQAAQPQDNPDSQHDAEAAGQPAGSTGQDEDPGDSDAPQGEDAGPGAGDEAGPALDPALVAAVTGHIEQILAAANATAIVLASNPGAALHGLDEVYEQAAEARRALKAAIGGRKAPATRPGGLRERVLDHLRAHPGKEFTPHQIHNVLGNSSGAIANALDTLVKLTEAELAGDKPRRFRLAAGAPAADAGSAGDGDGAGDAATSGAELAGAA